jgi:hypothetical protein
MAKRKRISTGDGRRRLRKSGSVNYHVLFLELAVKR